MDLTFLLILAAIMAIFGVMGFQRGTRFGLLMTGLLMAAVLVATRGGGQAAKLVNGLGFGVRFMLAGGLQALGGSGDKTEAIKQVMAKVGPVTPLLPTDQPGLALLLISVLVLSVAWLAGRAKIFKGVSSLAGLALGLVDGYIVTAILLTALLPDIAFLPLPFGAGGATASTAGTGPAAVAGTSAASAINRLESSLIKFADSSTMPALILAAVALFVLFAARFATRGGGKKG